MSGKISKIVDQNVCSRIPRIGETQSFFITQDTDVRICNYNDLKFSGHASQPRNRSTLNPILPLQKDVFGDEVLNKIDTISIIGRTFLV